jgi:hypothetical protein
MVHIAAARYWLKFVHAACRCMVPGLSYSGQAYKLMRLG